MNAPQAPGLSREVLQAVARWRLTKLGECEEGRKPSPEAVIALASANGGQG